MQMLIESLLTVCKIMVGISLLAVFICEPEWDWLWSGVCQINSAILLFYGMRKALPGIREEENEDRLWVALFLYRCFIPFIGIYGVLRLILKR